MFFPRDKKGFTLVEILMVVFLIAFLATVALQSYTNSTDTFKFLGAYAQLPSALNTARSNAISNRQQNGAIPKRYGVCITKKSVVTFADSGSKEAKLDLLDANKALGCTNVNIFINDGAGANEDALLPDKSVDFSSGGYTLEASDPKGVAIALPILVFYESGTGNLTMIDSNGLVVSKNTNKFVNVKFSNKKSARYAKIYQVSGLVEEAASP